MPDAVKPPEPALPPAMQLIQMASAYWVSRIVHAAAELGLADHLAQGPLSAADIAGKAKLNAPALHRLMRSLAGLGILDEGEDKRFALTPLGEALKSGKAVAGSARAAVLTLASPWFSTAMDQLSESVRSGATAFEKINGMPVFDFLGQRPEAASLFSETMVGIHGSEPPAVAEAYDFSGLKTVVDVGGATGNMLAAILLRHKSLRGILADLPHVVKDAPAFLSAKGVSDRVSISPHNFFDSVPAGGDAYVLSHILHDWSEAQCLTILRNLHKAMTADARLLIVEMVLPGRNEPHFGKILDMVMLAVPGGEERTGEEYRALLAKAGFKLTRIVPTASPVSVIEAVKA
ncbi:methyltransferase [Aestuariivirga sp. YIM B02566]|uniref:Methyltransferase n=1 Tax=Taklimakanibacter albus TaxID=2800327 RepID=A0ACC5RFM2_9HYPH|nr:methyltransferase [Aestuariivirga sp. YIM B02566]MBK1871511.1 methyltransferase [Aestuariivirga sp. YIM B02566]